MSATDTRIPAYVRFIIAGAAGSGAAVVSHPFDLVKFRMQMTGVGDRQQMKSNTSIHATYKIVQTDGIMGLFAGISASILRQMTITMVRLGLYNAIVDKLTAADGTPPAVFYQILAGAFSGGVGAIVGNPADIALTRMATDGGLPKDKRRNYTNPVQAMRKMAEEEGLRSLWIGWLPHVYRCVVLNLTQFVLYKNTKVYMLHTGQFEDNTKLHVICSVWTALVSAIATAPLDLTKTRLQIGTNQDKLGGMRDVAMKIIKHEGHFALWKGFTPTFLRILPHNFTIFILLEHMTKLYKMVVLGDTSGSGY